MIAMLLLAASSAVSLEIASPREFQVFQRDAKDVGRVVVEVMASDEVGALGATLDLGGGAAKTFRPLEMEDLQGKTRRFHGVLEVPGGGWYALEFSAAEGGASLGGVRKFGVGEVFVVAGQSNSTNFGEERFPSQDDKVAAFDGER